MIFGTVDVTSCQADYQDCFLAHSLKTPNGRIGKGTRITATLALELMQHGISEILVAKLEEGDVHEDEAARTIATQLVGQGVCLSTARTGRVNLLATTEGLCCFDAQSIIEANAVDEGITIATLSENQWVAQGRMVATIKIIPYAVTEEHVQRVLTVLATSRLVVAAAKSHKVALIQTRLNSILETVLDKTRRVIENRLNARAASLMHESRCQHDTAPLATLIEESLQNQPDWLLLVGASAISDRADVIPEAIIKAGGAIDRYGIPVDPGNLLLLAHIGSTHVIGLPGCARSPRYNGLDMIFDRMACEVPVTDRWLVSLSVGGLLTEIADRPAPRISALQKTNIGAVILAAGSSKRAGPTNKLLTPYGEHTMVSHIVNIVCDSQASRVVAVTGYENSLVENALSSSSVACHYNKAFDSGMASSVVTGVSQLTDTDGVLVCLGDMPHITTDIINQLIDAFKKNPDKSIFVPVHGNQRGNPVLFSKVFFDTLLTLKGDTGAKKLIQQYPDAVCEVIVSHDAVLLDYDTPDELAKVESGRT